MGRELVEFHLRQILGNSQSLLIQKVKCPMLGDLRV